MTMFALSRNKSQAQAAQAGEIGVFFFLGRLSAHSPGDLALLIKAQAPTLDGPHLQAEVQRCGPMVEAGQRNFQAALLSLRPPAAPGAAPVGAVPAARPAPTPAPAGVLPPTASGLPPAIPQAAPK